MIQIANVYLATALAPVLSYDASLTFSLILHYLSFQEPFQQQLKVFIDEVMQQQLLPTIRSYLKLYTTLPLSKLAAFMEMTEDELRTHLMCFKHKMKNVVWMKGTSGLDGEFQSASEVDFYIDKDMIHIADTKVARRYGDFFIRQIHKFEELSKTLKTLQHNAH